MEWTDEAQDDIDSIADWYADNPERAEAILDGLIARLEQLSIFPRSGSLAPGVNPAHVRQMVEGQYRVLYAAGPETIMVLGVPHVSRML